MKHQYQKIGFAYACLILLAGSWIAWGYEPVTVEAVVGFSKPRPVYEDVYQILEVYDPSKTTLTRELTEDELREVKHRISKLESKITNQKGDLDFLTTEMMVHQESLDEVQDRKRELQNQLEQLSSELKVAQTQVDHTGSHIELKKLQILELEHKITGFQKTIDRYKSLLGEVVQILYDESLVSEVDRLLDAPTFAESLNEVGYLVAVEDEGIKLYEQLADARSLVVTDTVALQDSRRKLQDLEDFLQIAVNNLKAQQEGKGNLLSLARNEENLYQTLLEDARRKQLRVHDSLSAITGDLEHLKKEKVVEIRRDPEKYAFLDRPTRSKLSWPVAKAGGITAHFKDSSYYRVFGVPHYAIDIRALQGTAVRAAADAYVHTVANNGFGYSYIVLAHGRGLTTVYGHMSKMLVRQGDVVRKGDVIGLSGGTPGTKGAGWMTTGAHLHFEVRLEGRPQDPMKFLP